MKSAVTAHFFHLVRFSLQRACLHVKALRTLSPAKIVHFLGFSLLRGFKLRDFTVFIFYDYNATNIESWKIFYKRRIALNRIKLPK